MTQTTGPKMAELKCMLFRCRFVRNTTLYRMKDNCVSVVDSLFLWIKPVMFPLFRSPLIIKMNTATGMHPLSQNVVWEEGVTSVSGEIPLLLQYHLPLYTSVYILWLVVYYCGQSGWNLRLFYLCGTMIIMSFDLSCDVLISAWPYLVRRSNECQATRIVFCVPLC